jgi:hypothetical protein
VRISTDPERDVVDPDDPSQWPDAVRALCGEWESEVAATEYLSDLELGDSADSALRASLQGQQLRAYHATRLLPHEVDGIRSDGLRVFSRQLVDNRIDAAHAHGHLTGVEADELRAAHMFAVGEDTDRGNRSGLWVTLRMASLGLGGWPLMSHWGGEGINFSSGATHLGPLLRRLGRPTIVVVAVPVASSWRQQGCYPSLDRLFLGSWRGLAGGSDLHVAHPIPGTNILEIWQSGDSAYGAISNLPSS